MTNSYTPAEQVMGRWISVEEMPEMQNDGVGGKESDTVLVFDTGWTGKYTAYYGREDCDGLEPKNKRQAWHVLEPKGKSCRHLSGVTHWQPLPLDPGEG